MTKNSSSSCFMPVFMSYCTHFLVLKGGFAWPGRPDTCLRVMRKNPSFSSLIVVFMNYCPQVWHSGEIYNDLKTRYMFEDITKNSSFSCFMAVFMSYSPLLCVLGSFTCLRVMTKNLSFLRLWPFS